MTFVWVLVAVVTMGESKNGQFDSKSSTSVALVEQSYDNQKECVKKIREFYKKLRLRKITHGGVECVKVAPRSFENELREN